MNHSFDVDEAVEYGVNKAVLINHLRYWLTKNKANESNCNDGYYWTYNSSKAFGLLFPYFNPKSIGRWLRELENDGILVSTDKYNKLSFDKTKWFTIPFEFSIAQNDTMGCPKLGNRLPQTGQAIPDLKPNITTDDLKTKGKYLDEIKEVLGHLNTVTLKSFKNPDQLPARFAEGYTVEDALKVINNKLHWIGTDQQQYMRPQTLFCKKKFDAYLNELPQVKPKPTNQPVNVIHTAGKKYGKWER